MSDYDQELDARHLLCPMPVIKVQQAMSAMKPGQVLRVVCTDPGVRHDIPAWVRVHGHQIIADNMGDEKTGDAAANEFVFLIRASGE